MHAAVPLALVLASFALGAAACGDSGGSTGTSGSGGSGTTTGSTGGSGGTGGASSDVALVDEALDGACPNGTINPGTGVAPGSDLHRVTLSDYPEAKCNDGSPAIMYVRRASAPAAETSWIVFLQFGGACQNWEICRDRWCGNETSYDAAKMSSRFAPEAMEGNGLFKRNQNNAFAAANQVFVYYCSSDTWLGQKDDVVLEDPEGVGPSYRMHVRGFSIVEAVEDALSKGVTSDDGVETMPKFSDATRILFAGGSAGSAGQTHALDWWASKHPSAETVGYFDAAVEPLVEDIPNATVAETVQSYLPTRHQETFVDFWGAHLDESCLAAHPGDDAYLCSVGTHVRLNHITTPYFVRHDLTDPVGFNGLESLGLAAADYAKASEATMTRFTEVLANAEEKEAMTRAPGVMASNCKQHIVTMNDAWFGVTANPATVDLPNGMPVSVHDALGAWINGNDIQALDTVPATKSKCLMSTNDQ
jgi:hypothetical protein